MIFTKEQKEGSESTMIFTKEQKQGRGELKDVPLGHTVEFSGMHTPLTNDESWKYKVWSRKSTRIGVLGVVVIGILLSAIVALAVLLFESRNDSQIRETSVFEGVYDIPNAELMRTSSDMYSRYTTMGYKQTPTSESSKDKEGEEAIAESAKSSGHEDTSTDITSSKEHKETSTTKPNTFEYADTSTEITIKPDNQESTSSSEHETPTERNGEMLLQELYKKELQLAEALVIPMNTSSDDAVVDAVSSIMKLEMDLLNNTDYDDSSEIRISATYEAIFGDSSELGSGKAPEMEHDYTEDEDEGLFDDSVIPINTSSDDAVVDAVSNIMKLEMDLLNNTDYDDLSEIDFGGTSEVIFGYSSELGSGRASEMEHDYTEDEDEGLFDDSDDTTPLQNELRMVPKSEWGGAPPMIIFLHTEPRPYVVISQTNSWPCFDQDSCSQTMRTVQAYDMQVNNLPDICENYYISGDGTVYVGRGPTVTNCDDGFVKSENIGISFIGDFDKYPPTTVQVKALEQLLSVIVSQHVLNPDYKIIAKKEISIPESLVMGPGKFLLEEIDSMPHRCNSSCIDNIFNSDYDDNSSNSNSILLRFFG